MRTHSRDPSIRPPPPERPFPVQSALLHSAALCYFLSAEETGLPGLFVEADSKVSGVGSETRAVISWQAADARLQLWNSAIRVTWELICSLQNVLLLFDFPPASFGNATDVLFPPGGPLSPSREGCRSLARM